MTSGGVVEGNIGFFGTIMWTTTAMDGYLKLRVSVNVEIWEDIKGKGVGEGGSMMEGLEIWEGSGGG